MPGRLASTIGKLDHAAQHFEAALVLERGWSACAWLVKTRAGYAATLAVRGELGRPRPRHDTRARSDRPARHTADHARRQASHVALNGQGWGARGWITVTAWTAILSAAGWAYRRDTNRV